MLGRDSRSSPQFISSIDGSWLGVSACIERMTQRSSTCSAVCGEDLADLDAALAVLLEPERRPEARCRSCARCVRFPLGQRLACVLVQERLGVEGIDLRRSAVQEDVDDVLGLGGEVRRPRRQRIAHGIAGQRRRRPPPPPSQIAESPSRPKSPMIPIPVPTWQRALRRSSFGSVVVHDGLLLDVDRRSDPIPIRKSTRIASDSRSNRTNCYLEFMFNPSKHSS